MGRMGGRACRPVIKPCLPRPCKGAGGWAKQSGRAKQAAVQGAGKGAGGRQGVQTSSGRGGAGAGSGRSRRGDARRRGNRCAPFPLPTHRHWSCRSQLASCDKCLLCQLRKVSPLPPSCLPLLSPFVSPGVKVYGQEASGLRDEITVEQDFVWSSKMDGEWAAVAWRAALHCAA